MEKPKKATRGQIGRIVAMLTSGRISFDEAQEIIERPKDTLPPDHYHIRVNRGPLPSMATLEGQFLKNGVSELFNGKYEWKKHSSRMGQNDVSAGEVDMIVKQFTPEEIEEMGGLEVENIIAWGLKNGLVPADEKETYAFGINPETYDFQREFDLVGLGSSAVYDDGQCVARLHGGSGGRFLLEFNFGRRWYSVDRFLFVRKVS